MLKLSSRRSALAQLVRTGSTVFIALLFGFVITLFVSDRPVQAYVALLAGPLSSTARVGTWIEDATTLTMLGLSIAIVFRAQQFSLLAEGQLYLGALAAGIIALHLPAPGYLHLVIAVLGAAAGFVFGLIPGALKAYYGANEIVSTLMLNVVAVRTYIGYELRMVGANLDFARYGGINVRRTIMLSMALAGIPAALAGAHLAMGVHQRLLLNISLGLAFEGIVVALMAGNHPLIVPVAALLYSYLRIGGDIMERTAAVGSDIVRVIQATIILFITAELLVGVTRQRRAWRRADALG